MDISSHGASWNDHWNLVKSIRRAEKIIRDEWNLYNETQVGKQLECFQLGSLRSTVVLDPIDNNVPMIDITPEMIKIIDESGLDEMHFNQVRLEFYRDLDQDGLSVKKAFGKLMMCLFGDAQVRNDRQLGINVKTNVWDSLRLECDHDLSLLHIAAMCSAIVRTKAQNKLWLRLEHYPDISSWWKWLAYGLFSKRARTTSTLNSITLSGINSMTLAEIQAFAAVLASDHPEEELYELPRVPGYGRCQVLRDNLECIRCDEVEVLQTSVTSLTIGFGDWDEKSNLEGLPLLLQSIGSSLKELTLDVSYLNISENEILRSCPHLDTLSLCGASFDVQLDFSCFRRNNELLPSLNCQWNDVVAVSKKMMDGNNPLSKCVTRLRLRFVDNRAGTNYEESLKSLLEMLKVNQTLEYLDVIIQPCNFAYFSKFREHHLEPLNKAQESFSMEGKVAFLSTMSSERNACFRKTDNNLSQQIFTGPLNQHVVSTIFAFAAPPLTRKVFFWSQNVTWNWRNTWITY
ncbi:hypothetical protein PHMEG_0006615 [Phytophthora megakarya]|uniref:Uncharacterized protein n=1 Tax=Phytophthora megakarya TaxID=4795 RepID=A0A225WNQ5_9STRA|nr:hypothetical protein PHMEG_0006615 [Phytophthora megakarya]